MTDSVKIHVNEGAMWLLNSFILNIGSLQKSMLPVHILLISDLDMIRYVDVYFQSNKKVGDACQCIYSFHLFF